MHIVQIQRRLRIHGGQFVRYLLRVFCKFFVPKLVEIDGPVPSVVFSVPSSTIALRLPGRDLVFRFAASDPAIQQYPL